jgi:hypothetical protein
VAADEAVLNNVPKNPVPKNSFKSKYLTVLILGLWAQEKSANRSKS